TVEERKRIARDTIYRTAEMISQFRKGGASAESTFFSNQLPPLESLGDGASGLTQPEVEINVINSDSYISARTILAETSQANGKTAVLNLASDEEPAGGWIHSFTRTQARFDEEALCYSSTLYATLKPKYYLQYPWPNLGPGSVAGVFSPGVVVFKDDLAHHCADLPPEDRVVVSL
ncbi:hypothetical protein B0H15DRAFT_743299, partial [Mycena belliarum]